MWTLKIFNAKWFHYINFHKKLRCLIDNIRVYVEFLPHIDSFSWRFFKWVSISYYLLAKTTSRTIILRPGCVSSFVLNDYRKIVKQLNINNDVWRNSKIASGDIFFQCYYYYFQFWSLVDSSMVKSDLNLSFSSWRF